MKIVYVVDCITDITKKINTLTNKFGNNILYVVRADLAELFKTYGYLPNAVYYKNLIEVTHSLLLKSEVDDIIVCYASLKFNNTHLTRFANAIGDKSKIVNAIPEYNVFERFCNSAYNIYVNSLFKMKDGLASQKLQFIPSKYLQELLNTHLGNRMFEFETEISKEVYYTDKEISDSMKSKTNFLKSSLLSAIIALLITIGMLASIAYFKVSYLIILTCVIAYILDIMITIIFHCKSRFDQRFLK